MHSETFWERYKALCRENDVTPREIAYELGACPATVTRWRNGSVPHDRFIKRIADRLNVSADYLVGNSHEEEINFHNYTIIKRYGVDMDYERFVEKCKENGYTPTSLVNELNISNGNLGSWKKNGNPSVTVLFKIAEKLRCSLDYLLGFSDYSLTVSGIADKSFVDYKAVPDRIASLKAGKMVFDFEKLVASLHCTHGFLLNDVHISYIDVFDYENYSKAVPDRDMEYVIMECLDCCANNLDYRILQIQISRVILFWVRLLTFLLDISFDDIIKAVPADKTEYLLTGKKNSITAEYYGLNLSDVLTIFGRLKKVYAGINFSLLFFGVCSGNDVRYLRADNRSAIFTFSENNIARFYVPFPDISQEHTENNRKGT